MTTTDSAPSTAPPITSPPPRKQRWWLLLLVVAVGVGVGAWIMRRRAATQNRAATTASPDGTGAQDRPVPVLVASVERRDVPVYLEGLGTVTAYNTVAVRPRVEGRLDAVLFREGQLVHPGDVLAQIDPRPFQIAVRQAEATVARDRAQLLANRRTLDRARLLRTQNLNAQQDVDTALGAVDQSAAMVRADETQVASARLSLSFARITSPIEGVTGLRLIDAGNIVRVNDATGIVVITQVDPIAVLFTVPQDDLPRIAEQMARGPLTVDVFSRDGESPLASGQLTVVDNQINPTTGTARLKAVFANANRALWPQQFVKARLLLATRHGALVVPAPAVQRGPRGTFVYVVGADQRATARPVRVERVEGELAILNEGVNAGEQVVTEGQSRLRPGARVSTRPPESAPGGADTGSGAAPRERRGGRGRPGGGAGGAGAAGDAGPGGIAVQAPGSESGSASGQSLGGSDAGNGRGRFGTAPP